MFEDHHADLVRRAQAGDRAASDALAREIYPLCHSLASRAVRGADADDLCQDIMLIVVSRLADVRDPRRLHGWVKKIAFSVVANYLKRVKPRWVAPPDGADAPLVDDHVPVIERQDEIAAAVRSLSPMDQRTVDLFYFQGLGVKGLMEQEGIPSGTAKRRLWQARQRVGAFLEAQAT